MSLLSNDEFAEFNSTDQRGHGNWVNYLERFVKKSSCKYLYQVLVKITVQIRFWLMLFELTKQIK